MLGALIEKEITTPEYYPLSLNALVNACNQKSNRDPVVSYDDESVQDAFDTLRHKGLLTVVTGAGSRVPKFAHRFAEKLNLGRRETAILCELMLRGPQTVGEIRTRTERLHRFQDLDEVESLLGRMAQFAVKLPRRAGEKECRYAHLLSGTPTAAEDPGDSGAAITASVRPDRMAALEDEVATLSLELAELKRLFAQFRKQFE